MLKTMGFLVASLLITSELFAQNVVIRGVRLSGSGCNGSSASAVTTDDGQTLSVIFDNYIADIGNGSSHPQSTSLQLDCHVLIDVDVPPNTQYALMQTDYRGFAALPASAYGFHRFTQIVPNQPIASMREAQLRGPVSTNYAVSVQQKPGRYVYSPCNKRSQTIDLFSQLFVSYLPKTSDRSIAMINLDSVDTGVSSSFRLSWRACK